MLYTKLRINTLKIAEVAWLLDTDVSTIQRWVNSGIIKSCRTKPSGEPLFRREDVASLLASLGA